MSLYKGGVCVAVFALLAALFAPTFFATGQQQQLTESPDSASVAAPAQVAHSNPETVADLTAVPPSMFLPAAEAFVVAGSPTLGNVQGRPAWLLDQSKVESVGWYIDRLPPGWDTTFDITAVVQNPSASSGVATFSLANAWSTDSGAAAAPTDAPGGTAKNAAFTGAQFQQTIRTMLTTPMAVVPGQGLTLVLRRAASLRADTLTNDAALLGVRLTAKVDSVQPATAYLRDGRSLTTTVAALNARYVSNEFTTAPISDPLGLAAVPASMFLPAAKAFVVAGSPTLGNVQGRPAWLLDQAKVESVGWYIDRLPPGWDTSFDIAAVVQNPSGSSGVATFSLANAWSTDSGAAAAPTDTSGGTAKNAAFTGAPFEQTIRTMLTTSMAVVPGQSLALVLRRAASAVADTLINDAALLGVRLMKKIDSAQPGSTYLRDGRSFTTHSPNKPYSIVLADRVDRFELRQGDEWSGDRPGTKNRAELSNDMEKVPWDTDIWLSYAVRLPAAAVLKSSAGDGTLINQFVPSAGTNDLCFRTHSGNPEQLVISSRSNPLSQVVFYTGPGLQRDVWEHFVVKVRFVQDDTGTLDVWRNGVQLVNLTGLVIGNPQGDPRPTGPYFKYGLYRNASTEHTMIEYANLELGTTDLSARITSPLATPR